jgi:hypothetical protein
MLRDQGCNPSPGREVEQTFDEARAEKRTSPIALATPCITERVKLGVEGCYFGGVQEIRYVADSRATRYLASCHASFLSCGQAPGSSRFAGALFLGFAGKSLTRASDGTHRKNVDARTCVPLEKSLQRGTCLVVLLCYTQRTTSSCCRVVRKGLLGESYGHFGGRSRIQVTFVNVRIAYVDDAGDPETLVSATSSQAPVFVLAAVSFEQARLHRVTMEYLALKRRHFPGLRPRSGHLLDWGRVEIKGAQIRKMARSNDRAERRHAIVFLDEVLTLLESHRAKVFGRLWIKGVGTPINRESMTAVSVQAACETFQDSLRDSDDNGLMVIDSSSPRLNAALSHSVFTQKFKASGDRYDRLLEMPVFGHSENHAGLQLADLMASAVVYPIATHSYCTGHVTSVHVHPRFAEVKRQCALRLKALQYRYYDRDGDRRGGITVSDVIGHRPGALLFR